MGILSKIGHAARSVHGWIFLLWTAIPTTITYAAGVMEDFPVTFIIPMVAAALAAGLAAAYYSVQLFDYCIRYLGKRAEFTRVAETIDELIAAGHETMAIGDLATIWNDGNVEVWSWNPRLRRIKAAVTKGLVRLHETERQGPSKRSAVYLKDVARVFRDGSIGSVFEE